MEHGNEPKGISSAVILGLGRRILPGAGRCSRMVRAGGVAAATPAHTHAGAGGAFDPWLRHLGIVAPSPGQFSPHRGPAGRATQFRTIGLRPTGLTATSTSLWTEQRRSPRSGASRSSPMNCKSAGSRGHLSGAVVGRVLPVGGDRQPVETVIAEFTDGDNDDPKHVAEWRCAGKSLAANPRVSAVAIYGISAPNWGQTRSLLPLGARLLLYDEANMDPSVLDQRIDALTRSGS